MPRPRRFKARKPLSGNSYVVAVLLSEDDWFRQVLVPSDFNLCEHVHHVCPECIKTWNYDWAFLFARTAAGRRLRDAITEKGDNPETYETVAKR